MTGKVTMQLRTPVPFGKDTITELTFRRPKGKDMRARRESDSEIKATLDLIARLSGQPDKVVDEMDVDDIEEAATIIAGFRKSGPKTNGDEPTP